ncbi:MAG TPA: hypothetical protein VFI30_03095 [Nocardioidaceae bacterium]|nr:hypothetical protein [Nocardioidaceae bacterium]
MWWLVGVAAALVVLGALDWWTSGRARPLGRIYGDDLAAGAVDSDVIDRAAGYSNPPLRGL